MPERRFDLMPGIALKTQLTARLDSIIFIQLAAAVDTHVLPRVCRVVYFAHGHASVVTRPPADPQKNCAGIGHG
jgi:hypothetical protein